MSSMNMITTLGGFLADAKVAKKIKRKFANINFMSVGVIMETKGIVDFIRP